MCYSSDIPLFLFYTIPSTSKVDGYDYVLNKSFKQENWSFYGYQGVTQNIFWVAVVRRSVTTTVIKHS